MFWVAGLKIVFHASRIIINSIFEICLQHFCSADFSGLDMLHEVIKPELPVHWRKERGGQLKTWMSTLREDVARLRRPVVHDLRR